MLNPYYVTGLVDGEGSFFISFSKRNKMNLGWETRPTFSVSQNAKSRGVLFQLRNFFKCGFIRPNKSDGTYKYEVRSTKDLVEKIIPHFEKHKLITAKKADFELFKKAVLLIHKGNHLSKGGLVEIVKLAGKMNPSGRRNYPTTFILSELELTK